MLSIYCSNTRAGEISLASRDAENHNKRQQKRGQIAATQGHKERSRKKEKKKKRKKQSSLDKDPVTLLIVWLLK